MKLNNRSIALDTNRILDLKAESISDVMPMIQPTVEIKPRLNIIKSVVTDQTIYTTPTDKDFYLTNTYISMCKAAGDTGSAISINAFIDGVATLILSIGGITGTVDYQSVAENYGQDGIKIDKGTIINLSITGTYTSKRALIKGYTRETTKGSM